MSKVLEKMRETVRARAIMYKSVVQTVLLYQSNSWMITGTILKLQEVFHHRIAWMITGNMNWRVGELGW